MSICRNTLEGVKMHAAITDRLKWWLKVSKENLDMQARSYKSMLLYAEVDDGFIMPPR